MGRVRARPARYAGPCHAFHDGRRARATGAPSGPHWPLARGKGHACPAPRYPADRAAARGGPLPGRPSGSRRRALEGGGDVPSDRSTISRRRCRDRAAHRKPRRRHGGDGGRTRSGSGAPQGHGIASGPQQRVDSIQSADRDGPTRFCGGAHIGGRQHSHRPGRESRGAGGAAIRRSNGGCWNRERRPDHRAPRKHREASELPAPTCRALPPGSSPRTRGPAGRGHAILRPGAVDRPDQRRLLLRALGRERPEASGQWWS